MIYIELPPIRRRLLEAMTKRLVILQDAIMPYRKAVFNRIAQEFDLWVVHSGAPTVQAQDAYREVIVPVVRAGPFRFQAVGKALKNLSPVDAILVIFDLRWALTLLRAWRVRNACRLLWGHRQSRNKWVNFARLAIMRLFDGIVQYGEEDIPSMLAGGIPRDRIFVAPNTIEVPNHSDTSKSAKSSLLYVGRLQRRKRLEEFLEAYADLSPSFSPEVRVEIVGDGDIRSELEARAVNLGIGDRVIFHGAISDADSLKAIFGRALAYVSPDNVGLGVLHAFAYGVPVITGTPRADARVGFRHGPEYHNIRNGENGLLFTGAEELRDCLRMIVADREAAARLGRNAYISYTRDRSVDAMAEGIRASVEGCIASRARTAD